MRMIRPFALPNGARRAASVLIAGAWTGAAAGPSRGDTIALHVPVRPAPIVVSGAPHLVYELEVTNGTSDTVTLRRLQVIDADRRTEISVMTGDAFARRITHPGHPTSERLRTTIEPGGRAVVFLEYPLPDGAVPRALAHHLQYDVRGVRTPAAVASARVTVLREPPPVLGPPLRGGPWVAVYDPSWERGHRRVFYEVDGRARLPGRYAIDWIRLDAAGRFARGDPDRVQDWLGYGAEVLAVADAVVAATRDDMPESTSVAANGKHSPADAAGNYVVLDLGRGRYAFYEHLRPGSVRVRRGARVRRGQVLGALGYTGDSTGPHLHFHVADGVSPLGAEGVPYALSEFTVLGAFRTLDAFGRTPWTPHGELATARRTAELPAPGVVVDFGSAR
ncbi:MAG: M23 family metallopeptidase [Gemmatimonadaceae bacterium]